MGPDEHVRITVTEERFVDEVAEQEEVLFKRRRKAFESAAKLLQTREMFGTKQASLWEILTAAEWILTGDTRGAFDEDEERPQEAEVKD